MRLMKTLALKIIALPVATLLFVSVAGAVSLTVEYKPFGVPDSKREEYENRVRVIQEKEILLAGDQTGIALPIAKLDHSHHDFGMVDPHTTMKHDFVVRNGGTGPLALDVASTSCKCTVGRLTSNLVSPGAEATITMEWNTGYQADHYEQTATIHTNDPIRSVIELKVAGEVRGQLIAPNAVSLTAEKLGDLPSGDFVLFSQLWNDFTVLDISADGEETASLIWDVMPIDNDDVDLADKQSRSAVRVQLLVPHHRYGEFSGELQVVVRPGGGDKDVVRKVAYSGKVRRPISFVSPQLDKHDGLDIGTLTSGKKVQWHLLVQVRGGEGRQLEVLDVEPKVLQTKLRPTSREGTYRLTLTIPADCASTTFNLDHQRGYVQVGDPSDSEFSNWFPVIGAVAEIR